MTDPSDLFWETISALEGAAASHFYTHCNPLIIVLSVRAPSGL